MTPDEKEPTYIGDDLWDAICGGMPVPYEPSYTEDFDARR